MLVTPKIAYAISLSVVILNIASGLALPLAPGVGDGVGALRRDPDMVSTLMNLNVRSSGSPPVVNNPAVHSGDKSHVTQPILEEPVEERPEVATSDSSKISPDIDAEESQPAGDVSKSPHKSSTDKSKKPEEPDALSPEKDTLSFINIVTPPGP